LIAVNQWGDIEWQTMANAFYGASNVEILATDVPDLTKVENMVHMFH
jgi:hypothetical protein